MKMCEQIFELWKNRSAVIAGWEAEAAINKTSTLKFLLYKLFVHQIAGI